MSTQAALSGTETPEVDYKNMANAIRALAMDAVQKANSGHPGMPMGMADVATILFSKFLKFDPLNPAWPDRDRFILSGGHGSMLLYAVNYLTGYEKMTMPEIKNFRQLGSLTPGHPEVDVECGIEMTTGPLGQGIASSVGFALAERIMANHFPDLTDHYTYVFCGDGDLMEGISHEACSFAGRMKLSKLIVMYDDNNICIDGSTDMTFTDDTRKRFEAYGWDVQEIDGHGYDEITNALNKARGSDTPSLICCKTHIGFGAPTKQDSAAAHGAPLGEDEIAGARKNLDWPHEPFEIPLEIMEQWRMTGQRNQEDFAEWQTAFERNRYRDRFMDVLNGDVGKEIAPLILQIKQEFAVEKPKLATRQTSGKVLEKLVVELPFMIGGSADLTGSVNTKIKGPEDITPENGYNGQYIYYGVREHGMAAIMNGMALHGGIIPYAGTFLQFADYSRPAIRLGALMKQRVIHVMTHDSIGLGEDGPTHQPVEHLAALRAIPNLNVYRPCDGIETAECWELALNTIETPSIMSLTRQGLPTVRELSTENKCAKGAYVLSDCEGAPDVTIFATGSEVSIALEAKDKLKGMAVRVISVPCMDLFFTQDGEYQASLTCNDSIKVAIEAAVRQGWDRLIGPHGIFVGMTGFGDSAPASELYKHFGITADAVVEAVKAKDK
ncbi:MAG: transketolase [Rhodospirillales bacterium]|nr:transketolase [Rhodospirillales bacterium]